MSFDRRHRLFQLLYRRYIDKVRSRVGRILYNDMYAVDDIVQEAFMRAYMNMEKIYQKDVFLRWLFTVSRNLCLNYKRGSSRIADSNAFCRGYAESRIGMIADSNCQAPDMIAEKNELICMFRECMEKLTPKYKIAVQLCGIEGLSYSAAAARLNTSANVIAHDLMRAKRLLSSKIAIK
ncbi:MAG: RNA polymerase sigma factor [Candidatus Omnitrophota bacterium]